MLIVKIYPNKSVARAVAMGYANVNNGVFRQSENRVDLKSHSVLFIGKEQIIDSLVGRRFDAVDVETYIGDFELSWLMSRVSLSLN